MQTRSTTSRKCGLAAKTKIRRVIDSQKGNSRVIINVDDTLHWVQGTVETNKHFLTNYKKEALLAITLSISDGTFIRMYALPDHNSDIEPWYILNERATQLLLPAGLDITEILDNDLAEFELFIHGPVLLVRVDEDGSELGLTKDSYNDLCDMYLE